MIILTKAYCLVHRIVKNMIGKGRTEPCMINFSDKDFDADGNLIGSYNLMSDAKKKCDVYPVENACSEYVLGVKSFFGNRQKLSGARDIKSAKCLWEKFCHKAKIPYGYKNGGLCYGGYILEKSSWCLPSWIWTNAALARRNVSLGNIDEAKETGEQFLSLQHSTGGFVVRSDYENGRVISQLAPNDSAYIAANALIPLYLSTKDERYLNSACACADWIISTARPDGFVYLGFDTVSGKWITDRNIVDTGFTASLFAKLYDITNEDKYKSFLSRFLDRYIELFYNSTTHMFATAIDKDDNPIGGAFGRGQAWALEGLVDAYLVMPSDDLYRVISSCVNSVLDNQNKDGSWPYNFKKKLMGNDAKAVSVIAYSLMRWYEITVNDEIITAVKKALLWCATHTQTKGEAAGGIFSYTLEGAVAHHLYTSTAFVYASSYALEVLDKIEELKL